MRRVFGIVLLGLSLLACAPEVPDEPVEQNPVVTETEHPEHPSQPPSTGNSGKSGCDLYGTVEVEVNGMKIPVPVECNPHYFDKGDPPPDQPLPEKVFAAET